MAIDRVSYCDESENTLETIRALKNDPDLAIQQVARMVEFRIETGPDASDYKTNYICLALPTIEEPTPEAEIATTGLKAKIARIRTASEDRDYTLLLALMLNPADLSKVLINDTGFIHDPQRRQIG